MTCFFFMLYIVRTTVIIQISFEFSIIDFLPSTLKNIFDEIFVDDVY